MTKRYRLVLEEIEGSVDDEQIEVVATWSLFSRTGWKPCGGLWDDIAKEIQKARNGR